MCGPDMATPLQLSLLQVREPVRYAYAKQAITMIDKLGDGVWRSLADMEQEMGYQYAQTAISARVRDLRRGVPGFEMWAAERKDENGRHFYRIRRRA